MSSPRSSPSPAGVTAIPGSWPWKVCFFLLTATALSYLDRQALSVVAPIVRTELNLDNAQLGLLLSAFFYSYALMHLFVGYILGPLFEKYFFLAYGSRGPLFFWRPISMVLIVLIVGLLLYKPVKGLFLARRRMVRP